MATMQLSNILTGIRGPMQGTTFSTTKFGIVMKARGKRAHRITARHTNMCHLFSLQAGSWKTKTPAQLQQMQYAAKIH
jgi:hypothetical protein